MDRKWKDEQWPGGAALALSVARSSELGAEEPRGCVHSGGGPVEGRQGHLPAVPQVAQVAQVAQAAPEHPRWARPQSEGLLQRPGSAAVSAAVEVPGHRRGGAESQPLEVSEAQGALGRRAVSPAPGSPQVPASIEDVCRRGSVRGGGECEYV